MSAIYDTNFYYYNKRDIKSIYKSMLGKTPWMFKEFKFLENMYGKRFMVYRYYYRGHKDDPNAQTEEYWIEAN